MLESWVNAQSVPLGIGVDAVCISRLRELDMRLKGSLVQRTFSESEKQEAAARKDIWSYYAGRFAAKEAVFKAIAHLTAEKTFDFRIVETLTGENGCPYLRVNQELHQILTQCGVRELLISITNEQDYALAFVQAVK